MIEIYNFFSSVNLILLGLSIAIIYFLIEMINLMEEAKKNNKYFQVVLYFLLWIAGLGVFGFTIVNSFPSLK